MSDDDLLRITLEYIMDGKLECGNPSLSDKFIPNILKHLRSDVPELETYRQTIILSAVLKSHIQKYNVVHSFQVCSNTLPDNWKVEWFNYLSIALIE